MSGIGTAAPPPISVTPRESLKRGIGKAGIPALAAGLLSGIATWWVSSPLFPESSAYIGVIAFVAVGYGVLKKLLHDGYDAKNSVPFGFEGVATRLGDKPTGELLGPGDHFRFPGVEGSIKVDKRVRILDIKPFEDLAADDLPVVADEFLYVRTVDSQLLLMVEDADGDIMMQCVAQSRLFINQFKEAEDVICLKDELAEWLMLQPGDTAAHDQLKMKLVAENGKFVDGGIDAIMAQAGELVGLARRWGIEIVRVRVAKFDLAESFKEAAQDRAKQVAEMTAQKTQNTAARDMIEELVRLGVDPTHATDIVAMRQGLKITRSVKKKEFGITGLDPNAVVSALKPVIDATAERIKPKPVGGTDGNDNSTAGGAGNA